MFTSSKSQSATVYEISHTLTQTLAHTHTHSYMWSIKASLVNMGTSGIYRLCGDIRQMSKLMQSDAS